jgi:hypothetical protein
MTRCAAGAAYLRRLYVGPLASSSGSAGRRTPPGRLTGRHAGFGGDRCRTERSCSSRRRASRRRLWLGQAGFGHVISVTLRVPQN